MARQARVYQDAKDLIYPSTPETYPIIVINGVMYPVDNRMSTFNQVKDVASDDVLKIVEITMGKKALKEIEKMDLSVNGYKDLSLLIIAAINDMSFEEAKKMTEGNTQRFQ